MNSFTEAFRDYYKAILIPNTNPKVAYLGNKYYCFWWYSEETIKRIGGEVIYG